MIIHVVKNGDTVSSVAAMHNVSPALVAELNGINQNESLAVGQSLVILIPKTVYTAKQQDTLFGIAESFGTTLRQLYRNNPSYIKNPSVSPGNEIIIEYESDKQRTIKTNGYAYPYVTRDILIESLPFMTYLSPFTYGITYEGGLVMLNDSELLSAAAEYGVMPLMHLSTLTENGGFSNELASSVLNSDELQQKLISSIINTISEKGYAGLDIDFEFVLPEDSVLYAEFIRKIRSRLAPLGKLVYSALAPKTSDDQKGTLYEGHNYSLIGDASDGVLLMTYEWGYTYGPPMAVAPINSVKNVVEYALTRIPANKIFLGIPNYGYDWTLPFIKGSSRARSISNIEAVELAKRYGKDILFDEFSQTPHFNYTDENGAEHEVWFEDARSMNAKYKLIEEYNLTGAGFWNLMRPFRSNWSLLGNVFNIYGG